MKTNKLMSALEKLVPNSFEGHAGRKGIGVGGSLPRGAGGGMKTGPLKKGERVKIKKEFQDPGDDKLTFIVLGDEEKGRVDIQAEKIYAGMTIKPTQVARVEWLERIK